MKSDETKEDQKRLYEKPRLRTIELAAEEVLAIGCKTAGDFAAGGNPICGVGNNCIQLGS
jgi:hypothetical protein